MSLPRPVHDRMCAWQAQMQHLRSRAGEIEMVRRKLGSDAGKEEMRAPPALDRVETIREGRRPTRQRDERAAVDAISVTAAEQKPPVVIVADEAHRIDGQPWIETLEIDRHV